MEQLCKKLYNIIKVVRAKKINRKKTKFVEETATEVAGNVYVCKGWLSMTDKSAEILE